MNPDQIVPISALEHHLYCPRQCALIHVEGIWLDNEHTVRGQVGHRRVDSGEHRAERGRLVLRAIPLWSEVLGLTGRADAVEVGADGRLEPVEYKIGTLHRDAPKVQLCAQALCLEEMTGVPITSGALWISATRRRLHVDFDKSLRSRTVQAIQEIRSTILGGELPSAHFDGRCATCQFVDYCQPELCDHADWVDRHMAEVMSCTS